MRQTQLQLGVPLANLPDRGNYTKARLGSLVRLLCCDARFTRAALVHTGAGHVQAMDPV
jgi:hypothetical protein